MDPPSAGPRLSTVNAGITRASKDAALPPRIVIAGGGVAAIEALLALREHLGEAVQIELIAPQREFVYRPLSVREPFEVGSAPRFEIAKIAHDQGAILRKDALAAVDIERRLARTAAEAELPYDALVVAIGTEAREALAGAFTFRGGPDAEAFAELLDQLVHGELRRVAFAVPSGAAWPLPLYELALMTRERLADHGRDQIELILVTPEVAPLAMFGRQASEEVAWLLAMHRIEVHASSHPSHVSGDRLELVPGGSIVADRVVAMPRLRGWPIDGLPQDADGFLDVDRHGRVDEIPDVYAAGDITSFPVKQGGLATQQADAVAQEIAARFGAPIKPKTFRPLLRGLLLSAAGPHYLRADIGGGEGDNSEASTEALWWPSAKIVGRYLSPYLARHGEALARPARENGSRKGNAMRPVSWIPAP
jgi:sulfide:quinone oxidoreductase